MNYLNFHIFRDTVARLPIKCKQARKHLELLVRILVLDYLTRDGAAVFDSGFFGKGALGNLTKALNQSLTELRPQILNLAETMYIPDHAWPSVIGNEYGDIYEQQLELAQKSKLNQHEVPPYFEQLIKPILKGKL